LVIILLQVTGVLGWLGGLLARVATPVFNSAYEKSLTTRNWIEAYRQPDLIIEKNEQLIKENSFLREELYLQDVDRLENERLKSLLAYKEEIEEQRIIAKVAGRWDFGGETILTINKGKRDGVQAGDLVVNEYNILIGKISKMGETLSYVQLMTHPDFKLAVKRSSKVAVLGILSGEFQISAKVDLILQESDISVGEELFTTNIQGGVEGLRVGKVTEVNSKPGDLFKTAAVSPLYTLDNILYLQVIKKADGN